LTRIDACRFANTKFLLRFEERRSSNKANGVMGAVELYNACPTKRLWTFDIAIAAG
jgi:hypothetical protein